MSEQNETPKPRYKVSPVKPGAAPECVVEAASETEAEAKYRDRFPLLAKTVKVTVKPVG